jgi:hypothetical protein
MGPASDSNDTLAEAIAAARAGRRAEARRLLTQILAHDPKNEKALLWLSGVLDNREAQIRCLRRVLAVNPDNQMARVGLARLGADPADGVIEEAPALAPAARPEAERAAASLPPVAGPAAQPASRPPRTLSPRTFQPAEPAAATPDYTDLERFLDDSAAGDGVEGPPRRVFDRRYRIFLIVVLLGLLLITLAALYARSLAAGADAGSLVPGLLAVPLGP